MDLRGILGPQQMTYSMNCNPCHLDVSRKRILVLGVFALLKLTVLSDLSSLYCRWDRENHTYHCFIMFNFISKFYNLVLYCIFLAPSCDCIKPCKSFLITQTILISSSILHYSELVKFDRFNFKSNWKLRSVTVCALRQSTTEQKKCISRNKWNGSTQQVSVCGERNIYSVSGHLLVIKTGQFWNQLEYQKLLRTTMCSSEEEIQFLEHALSFLGTMSRRRCQSGVEK